MADLTNIANATATGPERWEDGVDPAKSQRAAFVGEEAIRSPMPELKGRVNRHTSGYWALAIPALSVRYLAEAGANVMGATRERIANTFKLPALQRLAAMTEKEAGRVLDKVEAPVVGTFMVGVSLLYLRRTYNDMKAAFSEAVAAETGKKPEDVGLRDLMKSDNTLVEAARRNFLKYNTRRFAVNSPFFSHYAFKSVRPKDAILFGVASNSIYLMSDVLSRKETFFERLQGFVDEKLLHTEKLGEKITAIDLINLYELHSRDKNPNYVFTGRMDTQEWQDRMKVFGRMAELMNETYGNQRNEEHANFTLSKMIYLMGHGMITSTAPERSLEYIEVASRYGIEAVKDMASKPMMDASDVKYAKEKYPTPSLTPQPEALPKDGFAAKITTNPSLSNTDKINAQRAAAQDATRAQTI